MPLPLVEAGRLLTLRVYKDPKRVLWENFPVLDDLANERHWRNYSKEKQKPPKVQRIICRMLDAVDLKTGKSHH